MAAGPNSASTSPPSISSISFLNGPFSPASSSPPKSQYSSQPTMATDVFSGSAAGLSHGLKLSPMGGRKSLEQATSSLLAFSELEPAVSGPESGAVHTILMRKLPRSTSEEALRSLLLFAKDLIDAELLQPDQEDKGFVSAIARFKTLAGAHEARDRLSGKPNAANDAKMIVELLQNGVPGAFGARRNTVDGTATASRQGSSSTTSAASTANGQTTTNRQSSRFNGTFRTLEKMSPPGTTPSLGNGEFTSPDHIQNLFSPQSPLGNSFSERPRNVGKSVINDEDDADTGELLKDPVAYAKSGQSNPGPLPRRTTNPAIPVSRFANLSLNTVNTTSSMTSPPMSTFASPRSVAPLQSPTSALSTMSPHSMHTGMSSMGPNANHQMTSAFYQRHNYPPVNPADQNPPCNTLYVGNLPMDTSEDELKAMFSKQRGYKRLCFRTKQNGPMCFVEFEDVSFATKALNELYGHPLHNSVKGGIRLSFSKNPLGVRSGQNTSMAPPASMNPQAIMPGIGSGLGHAPGFSTATGPPPGLSAPPGLGGMNMNSGSNFGMYTNGSFGMAGNPMASHMRSPPVANGNPTAGHGATYMGGGYADYMMGR